MFLLLFPLVILFSLSVETLLSDQNLDGLPTAFVKVRPNILRPEKKMILKSIYSVYNNFILLIQGSALYTIKFVVEKNVTNDGL